MKKMLLLFLFIVFVAGGAFISITRDWQMPEIKLPETKYVNHELIATTSDNRGLGEICYYLNGKSEDQSCVYAGGSPVYEMKVDLSSIADGEHEVCITAADENQIFPNRASLCRSYTLDKVPPKGVLEAATRYMQRGGAAAVFVSTPEPETDIHVIVGEYQFPFMSNPDGTRHFAVFAHPHDIEMANFKPVVQIKDLAGNTRRLLVGTISKDRTFKTDNLNVPHSFIEGKALEMLNKEGSDKETFLEMNRDVRAASRAKLQAATSAAEEIAPMWHGAFYRNAGAPKAQFADHRTYLLDNEKIDKQIHFGLDIAGLATMPIRAANDGVVTFADYVGIYGNCILINHGGHVSTLYAHLSQIDVTPGTNVSREQVIGRSGNTGMAGGDHLHYATYVADVPVEPTEWFDSSWLKTRIDDIYKDFKATE
jgi:murein DD-endopeptidase MepM/ murein hydrolase activator NlpD